jgi:hypothetical protein
MISSSGIFAADEYLSLVQLLGKLWLMERLKI